MSCSFWQKSVCYCAFTLLINVLQLAYYNVHCKCTRLGIVHLHEYYCKYFFKLFIGTISWNICIFIELLIKIHCSIDQQILVCFVPRFLCVCLSVIKASLSSGHFFLSTSCKRQKVENRALQVYRKLKKMLTHINDRKKKGYLHPDGTFVLWHFSDPS